MLPPNDKSTTSPHPVRPDVLVYRYDPSSANLRQTIDAALASLALLAFSPILAVAALAILIDDGTPVLFTQTRVGRLGKRFTIYKLRTMKRTESGDRLSPRHAKDHRVTRVGRFLRKSSIDELPQLFNVVRGDMALVGPRPEMPFVVDSYHRWQNLRHLVTPGLTGIWQIQARKTVSLERPEATLMDLEYISKNTLLFDLSLIARTVLAVLSPKGAF